MNKHSIRKLNIALLFLLVLIPSSNASANALPPPVRIWFRFVNGDNSVPDIDGLQVVGCSDENCLSPIILRCDGKRSTEECGEMHPLLSEETTLRCVSDRCLFEIDYLEYDSLPPYIQVILFSGNETLVSEVVYLPECYSCTLPWKVIVDNKPPLILDDTEYRRPGEEYNNFFKSFIYSTSIELLVAGILMFVSRKKIISTVK